MTEKGKIERIRYWFWKQWYLSSFNSVPTRFIAKTRIICVYDKIFKESGLEEVKKAHKEHIERIRLKLGD